MKTLLLFYLLTLAFIPWILLAGKRPVSTLAWIWAVILFPFAGPLAFLLFGVDRITRPRRRQQRELRHERESSPDEAPPIEKDDASLFRALSELSGFPTSTATHLRLLPDGQTFFPALEQAIEDAREHAHVQFFSWEADEAGRRLRDVLIAAARRGVAVRVLVDRLACLHTRRRFFRPLVEAGGKIGWFRTLNPLRRHFALHLRNHRKLQIIDGQVAFVGGMNVGVNYLGKNPRIGRWRDLQTELEGPIVAHLQRVFADDWYFATDEDIEDIPGFARTVEAGSAPAQIVLGGPDLPIDAMADSFAALLHHATRRAWIAAAYFVPDVLLLSALRLAAARGVDVRLLASEKSDHPWLAEIGRSYYGQLLRGGVRIYEFRDGLHHAKAMLLDHELLMVGSANCDNRSMRLNFELNVLAHSPAAARELETQFLRDFAESREVTLDQFQNRPFIRRAIEAMVRPLAPMI
jgi:cardiolipin synthase